MRAATVPSTPEPIHFVGRWSSLVRSALQWILLWPVVSWFCYPFSSRGVSRLPKGPVVFIANHGSHADTAVFLRALPGRVRRRTVVAAAQDHFWRVPMLGGLVSLLTGAFPFPRTGCEGLDRAERLLERGYNVLLYPEGTRSNAGAVGEFQQGAAILAGRGATIVPVGLHGSADVLPKGCKRPRRHAVAVVFGDAVPIADATESQKLRRLVRVLADEARLEVATAGPIFFQRLRTFAQSAVATKVLFVWGFAEALLWPVVPDFALFPLVLVAPSRIVSLLAATTVGSLTGGFVAYLLGATVVGPSLLGAAPLVTEDMVVAANQMLEQRDGLGLLGQPLSGIPYKAFALQAAPAGVEVPDHLVMSLAARGGRFVAVALVGLVLARVLRPLWERAVHVFLVLYSVSFAAGLARVVASWS